MADAATHRWQTDSRGQQIMPEIQREFLDWLLSDEREPTSQAGWARAHGIDPKTVQGWKRDRRFRSEWDAKAAEKNISVERVQGILDMLHKIAVDEGDVQAAKLWLDHVSKLRPPTRVVEEGDYAQLSDEELVAQLEQELRF